MRHKVGGYYIDWSDFESTVSDFLKDHVHWFMKGERPPYMIAQRVIITHIMNEYDCSWTSAKTKLSLLVDKKRNLKWFINLDTPKGPYNKPYIRHFVIYKP